MKLKTVQEMTLKEKIGQLILPGFKSLEYDESLRTLIEDYKVANVILFTRNFENASQVRKLTKKIHEEVYKNTGTIPFIAIDQEGGLVTRMMKDVTFAPGPMTCAASGNDASYYAGRMLAEDMIQLGMNLNLAPSLDVNNNPDNPVINVRSFGDDPHKVASLGRRFIEGSLEYGVLPCGKHFPGHGDVAADSHLGLPTIPHDKERIHNVELVPFKENADILPCIMSAHILFPAYDKNVPATLSKTILQGLLREELGYKGLILSDCLEMKAIADHFGTPEGARDAIIAGIDIVDISHTLDYQVKALKLIEEAVLTGKLSMKALDQKVERILAYKQKTLPYLEKYFYHNEVTNFTQANKEKAQEIVDGSFTLIQGNTLPSLKDTLVIAPIAQAKTIIEDEFDDRNLAKVLHKELPDLKVYEYVQSEDFKNQILTEAQNYKQIVLFSYNAAVSPIQVDFINSILKEYKNVYVISLKGPMDYHKYQNLKNYACFYEYTPNSIRSVVKYFKGNLTPKGTSPITL